MSLSCGNGAPVSCRRAYPGSTRSRLCGAETLAAWVFNHPPIRPPSESLLCAEPSQVLPRTVPAISRLCIARPFEGHLTCVADVFLVVAVCRRRSLRWPHARGSSPARWSGCYADHRCGVGSAGERCGSDSSAGVSITCQWVSAAAHPVSACPDAGSAASSATVGCVGD
jgi:hypothetical protein